MRSATTNDNAPVARVSPDAQGRTTVRDLSSEAGQLHRGAVLAGKYRLEMLLGEGGMAVVWSAYHLGLEVPVAVKLLRGQAKTPQNLVRLRLEARAGARLAHPSIVRVLDVAATDQGEPFIVMELLHGKNLAELLARGPLRATDAVRLLLPIADALVAAHAEGIVHRDLKPDNVFLSNEGGQLRPKLLDFGIAKVERLASGDERVTERGLALGSPHYMSPEQARGEELDHRSDIWSFCVLLYKLLSGAPPFTGDGYQAVMESLLRDDPPPLHLAAACDQELSRIVRWGLAKDPANRPPSMSVLRRELGRWLARRGYTGQAAERPLSSEMLAPLVLPAPAPVRAAAPRAAVAGSTARAATTQRLLPLGRRRVGSRVSAPPRPPRRWTRALLLGSSLVLLTGALLWKGSLVRASANASVARAASDSPPLPGKRAQPQPDPELESQAQLEPHSDSDAKVRAESDPESQADSDTDPQADTELEQHRLERLALLPSSELEVADANATAAPADGAPVATPASRAEDSALTAHEAAAEPPPPERQRSGGLSDAAQRLSRLPF